MDSIDVFLAAATLGRGRVPVLPEDLRHLIWTHTFPREVLWCGACGVVVLTTSHDGVRCVVNSHPGMWEECRVIRS